MVRNYQRQSDAPLYDRQLAPGITMPKMPQSDAPEKMAQGISQDAARMASELNTTAEKLYNNRFESAARQMIQEVYMKNPANPEALRTDFNAAFEGLTKDASPLMVDELRAKFDILTTPHVTKATENKIRINTDQLKETGLTVLNQAINSLGHDAASMFSSNSQVAFDASRSAQLQLLTIDRMSHQKDEMGQPLFSAEQRVRLKDDAMQSLTLRGLAGWFDEQPNKIAAREKILSGEMSLPFYDEHGEVSSEINPVKEMNMHTLDKLKAYMARGVTENLNEMQKAQGVEKVNSALNGDVNLDPQNTEDKSDVNDYYEKVLLPEISNPNIPANQKVQSVVDYVNKVGLIPESLKSTIRATVRNGSPDQQAYISEIIREIGDSDKYMALNDISDPDQTYAINFSDLTRAGVDPEKAAEILKQQFDPAQKDMRAKRKSDYDQFKKDNKLRIEDDVKEIYASEVGWFSSAKPSEIPAIRDSFNIMYENALSEEYMLTGSMDVARKRAAERVRKVTGITNLNGDPRVVMYPVEKFYSLPNVPNSWIKDQLVYTAKKFEPNVNEEDIFIVNDELTAREANNNTPSYQILIKKNTGELDVLRDEETGSIVRFAPDRKPVLDKYNKQIKEDEKRKADLKNARKDAIEVMLNERDPEVGDVGYLPGVDADIISDKDRAVISKAIDQGLFKASKVIKKLSVEGEELELLSPNG